MMNGIIVGLIVTIVILMFGIGVFVIFLKKKSTCFSNQSPSEVDGKKEVDDGFLENVEMETPTEEPGLFPKVLPRFRPANLLVDSSRASYVDNYPEPNSIRTIEFLPQIQERKRSSSLSMQSKIDVDEFDSSVYEKTQRSLESLSSDTSPDTVGTIKFIIQFDFELETLSVYIEQVCALTYCQRGYDQIDPYAEVSLLPICSSPKKTKVHKKTRDPEFNEEFLFYLPASDALKQTVSISIYDFNPYGSHVGLGYFQIPLLQVPLRQTSKLWKTLWPYVLPDKEQMSLGSVLVSMTYSETVERLTVLVQKAKNLPLFHGKIAPDPFVKVTIYHNDKALKKKKTSVKKGTCTPVYNEALVFKVTRDVFPQLCLGIFVVHETFTKRFVVGRAVLSRDVKGLELDQFYELIKNKTTRASWFDLFPGKDLSEASPHTRCSF